MLRKIWAIAYKELYLTYTDRNQILIILVTPLALATIIGAAFSGFLSPGGNDVPIRNIPVAVVNLDAGTEANGTTINNGQTFVDLLVPPDDISDEDLAANTLYQLTNAIETDDAEAARAAVDRDEIAAAIIIPADFSASLAFADGTTITPVEVYGSAASPTAATIIRSIAETITAQIVTGNITVAATIEALTARAQDDPAFGITFAAASSLGGFQPDFAPAFNPDNNPVRIEQQTVSGEAVAFNPLVAFGAAQAVFFMMFTALTGANNLLEEQRTGTLQRLIASPTPRIVILLGKLVGTFFKCVVQVTLLVLALTLVGSLIGGELQFIWGNNLLLIALTIIAVALAASGLGALVTSLVRSPEQGNVIGGVIALAMGALGGAFFNVQAIPELQTLQQLTIVYWGVDAFTALSMNQTDIGLNLAVLLGLGAAMFAAGVVIFTRRLNI
ncbi:MAG: ABC transporter permease [Chloroflexi bacterium]|nr:ABC transporter permease [Chloroflexota bacterium]